MGCRRMIYLMYPYEQSVMNTEAAVFRNLGTSEPKQKVTDLTEC